MPNQTSKPGHGGPATPEGKAISSQNARKDGLFTARDFIRPGERDEYDNTRIGLLEDLNPQGELEFTFADEIVTASWRLRRCRLVESELALVNLDGEGAEAALENRQKSVDRARAQAVGNLRRSLAELRKIQTERNMRNELDIPTDWGLADSASIMRAIKASEPKAPHPPTDAEMTALLQAMRRLATTPVPASGSFCKPPEIPRNTPRNIPCPCGSGIKYKKCHGNPCRSRDLAA